MPANLRVMLVPPSAPTSRLGPQLVGAVGAGDVDGDAVAVLIEAR